LRRKYADTKRKCADKRKMAAVVSAAVQEPELVEARKAYNTGLRAELFKGKWLHIALVERISDSYLSIL